uniref:Molybdenum cofactor biosynthesis protein 1 n=1 Tax=Globisporangium ultimum (strain ATCC 200006 / CBS 805.95 / DAOM BR144) TaxID=431595 RepID=K3WDN0_GLOUD
MRRPTPEESLQQIRDMLQQIREAEHLKKTRAPNLVDRFGREHTYLRISLTERCNLRCRYCMPEDGVDLQPQDNLMSTAEIVRLARLFAAAGVNRIRLTGGEPLLRRDIVELVTQLRAIDGINSVGVTTNGITLQRKLKALQAAGVDRLNISLDTLHADKFTKITRRQGFQRVMDSIVEAQALGFSPVKINCVIMRHFNMNEIVDFVAFTEKMAIDVRFIEWMPFDSNKWNDETFVSFKEMMALIRERFPTVEKLADDPNDTSKAFHVPGFKGQFGFITSMSEHFCGSCNRLRLTADGNLKVCLFGNSEVSLRDAMRHNILDDDIRDIIDVAVKRKKFALGGHGDMYGISKAKNRPMILIGG